MRLSTVASIAVLAVSSAALAQVASSPVEQKTGANAPMADNAGSTYSGEDPAVRNVTARPAANTTAPPTEAKPSNPRR